MDQNPASGFELHRIKLLAEADKNLSSAGSSIRASESSEGFLWLQERPLLLSAIRFFEEAKKGYDSFSAFMKLNGKTMLMLDEGGVFIRDKDINQISSRIESAKENARNRYILDDKLRSSAQADEMK